MKFAVMLFAAAALAAQTPAVTWRWIAPTAPELEVDGLPWFAANKGELTRLPASRAESYRKPVWNLAQSPSGGRIRFRTDAAALSIRLEYPHPPDMRNMHAFGQSGVDLYVDGGYFTTATPDKDAAPGKIYERTLFDFHEQRRIEREITLYLPLYMSVKVLGIGVDTDAKISRARPFKVAKPVVFYGTFITQGGCASRPGMSYQAMLGRALNIDFVNLGFSGNGMGEPELARAVADIDASAVVLDFAQNNRTLASLEQVYDPFIETIRAARPDVPIVAITPIYATREDLEPAAHAELDKMRQHIRQIVSRRIGAGDRNLQLIEGTDLLGPARRDGLVDGTHPNDLGFWWMAEGIEFRLRKVLALP